MTLLQRLLSRHRRTQIDANTGTTDPLSETKPADLQREDRVALLCDHDSDVPV